VEVDTLVGATKEKVIEAEVRGTAVKSYDPENATSSVNTPQKVQVPAVIPANAGPVKDSPHTVDRSAEA
jgi:hypothetical protein